MVRMGMPAMGTRFEIVSKAFKSVAFELIISRREDMINVVLLY